MNPDFLGKKLSLPWWPRNNPPDERDQKKILDNLALTVVPDEDKKPVGMHVALDSGRSILLPPHEFTAPNGRIYRDIGLKGVGPIKEFVGKGNKLNPWSTNGLTCISDNYVDLARMNILRHAGIHVPLGLLIIDTGSGYTGIDICVIGDTRSDDEVYFRSSIYVRAMTINTRIYNLRGIDKDKLRSYINYELPYLSRVEGEDLTDYNKYLDWFARRMAHQAAKMQKIGYLHGVPITQQICLDGTICDFEHEFDSGFLKDPNPDDLSYDDKRFTYGKQPKIFSAFVAHESFEDNLWQILRRISERSLPDKDGILEVYWREYEQVYANWEPPPIDDMIKAYSLHDRNLIRELCGTVVLRKNAPPRKSVFRLGKSR